MTTRGPAKKPGMARLIGVAAFTVAGFLAAPRARAECPPNCIGQTLTTPNFSHQDLTGADFTGATIIGAVFIRANLTGAIFDNAKFQSVSGFPTQTPDFSFANLTRASFKGAQFEAPTYLTYATLTCADFSGTNINNGNAIFGDSPLISDASATCHDGTKSRTKFRGTTMSCEFIDDWKAFDLSGAVVKACAKQLSGRDFSGAIFSGVDFTNVVLDGDLFVNSDLTFATLNNTSLQCLTQPALPTAPASSCVDMSGAQLQGSHINNANLSGATLEGATLSNVTNDGRYSNSATLTQSHLRNVNLSNAQLSGVDFTLANFYGNRASNPESCNTPSKDYKGFTGTCASAHKATMTDTKFINAFVYGVDFTDAAISSADFTQAIVVGANFSGATITTNPNGGAATSFFRAYAQGTNIDTFNTKFLLQANLSNAFLDFRNGGNNLVINLSSDHNQFARCLGGPKICQVPTGQEVCVYITYSKTTVPETNPTITCPNGSPGSPNGCGTDYSRGKSPWQSNLSIGSPPQDSGLPKGWYESDATFEDKTPFTGFCNGKGLFSAIADW